MSLWLNYYVFLFITLICHIYIKKSIWWKSSHCLWRNWKNNRASHFSLYRSKPEGKQNDYEENKCQAGDFLQRCILNVDQIFHFLHDKWAGVDWMIYILWLQVSLKVGQGTGSPGKLHDDRCDKGDQVKQSPFVKIKVEKYWKSQYNK